MIDCKYVVGIGEPPPPRRAFSQFGNFSHIIPFFSLMATLSVSVYIEEEEKTVSVHLLVYIAKSICQTVKYTCLN